ncbi:hypothetical protein C8R45DRAFT_1127998 [Mycena sanguinolenta]|nr:hypothetical protein C8R45DRAFT_1127998 [Mycena sanguinolenta]
MIVEHVLTPSDIILSGGSFVLRPDLVQVLVDAVTPLGKLLDLAMKHIKLPGALSFHTELLVLTCTTGLEIATQSQVVWNWVHLVDKLYVAMDDLRSLQNGRPIYILGHEHPSKMRCILELLHPSLRVKLPAPFLKSYGFSIAPPHAREANTHSARAPCVKTEAGGPASPKLEKDTSVIGVEVNATLHTPSSLVPPLSVSILANEFSLSKNASMDELVRQYGCCSNRDSLCARTWNIVKHGALDSYDITGWGTNAHARGSRYTLQPELFIYVRDAVEEMHTILTHAASLLQKTTCFIVDLRHSLTETLQGASTVQLIHISWECLVKRLTLAQKAFEDYQRTYHQAQVMAERKAATQTREASLGAPMAHSDGLPSTISVGTLRRAAQTQPRVPAKAIFETRSSPISTATHSAGASLAVPVSSAVAIETQEQLGLGHAPVAVTPALTKHPSRSTIATDEEGSDVDARSFTGGLESSAIAPARRVQSVNFSSHNLSLTVPASVTAMLKSNRATPRITGDSTLATLRNSRCVWGLIKHYEATASSLVARRSHMGEARAVRRSKQPDELSARSSRKPECAREVEEDFPSAQNSSIFDKPAAWSPSLHCVAYVPLRANEPSKSTAFASDVQGRHCPSQVVETGGLWIAPSATKLQVARQRDALRKGDTRTLDMIGESAPLPAALSCGAPASSASPLTLYVLSSALASENLSSAEPDVNKDGGLDKKDQLGAFISQEIRTRGPSAPAYPPELDLTRTPRSQQTANSCLEHPQCCRITSTGMSSFLTAADELEVALCSQLRESLPTLGGQHVVDAGALNDIILLADVGASEDTAALTSIMACAQRTACKPTEPNSAASSHTSPDALSEAGSDSPRARARKSPASARLGVGVIEDGGLDKMASADTNTDEDTVTRTSNQFARAAGRSLSHTPAASPRLDSFSPSVFSLRLAHALLALISAVIWTRSTPHSACNTWTHLGDNSRGVESFRGVGTPRTRREQTLGEWNENEDGEEECGRRVGKNLRTKQRRFLFGISNSVDDAFRMEITTRWTPRGAARRIPFANRTAVLHGDPVGCKLMELSRFTEIRLLDTPAFSFKISRTFLPRPSSFEPDLERQSSREGIWQRSRAKPQRRSESSAIAPVRRVSIIFLWICRFSLFILFHLLQALRGCIVFVFALATGALTARRSSFLRALYQRMTAILTRMQLFRQTSSEKNPFRTRVNPHRGARIVCDRPWVTSAGCKILPAKRRARSCTDISYGADAVAIFARLRAENSTASCEASKTVWLQSSHYSARVEMPENCIMASLPSALAPWGFTFVRGRPHETAVILCEAGFVLLLGASDASLLGHTATEHQLGRDRSENNSSFSGTQRLIGNLTFGSLCPKSLRRLPVL